MEEEPDDAVADDELRFRRVDDVRRAARLVAVPALGVHASEVLRKHLRAVDVAHDVREELARWPGTACCPAGRRAGEVEAALPPRREPAGGGTVRRAGGRVVR